MFTFTLQQPCWFDACALNLRQLAVEQGFGGPESQEKAEWMVEAVDTWFRENDGIEPYEVEDFLADILNEEFDLRLEDNSLPEISRLICTFYRLCQENKSEEIAQRLNVLPRASIQHCQQGQNRVEEMDSDEEAPGPPPSSHSNVPPAGQNSASQETGDDMETAEGAEDKEDEDGFKVVRHGRKKR
ncbi:pre-rRNA-processing protein TSR2 homolog isoform X2 [Aplysia californica]|uniref:Pre-rRNA-processing protein TSR2 homolog n=1 Tax=Aplysia californica TaxID=6500 RepID=A0ABM0ZYW5_APLCA|nr:pre-rRNA-processing protein TSR2 homolog isoform X2 [Aplysia californica]